MPGPGAHLLYALSGGAALSRLAGPGDRRFGAHHCAVYAANAFLGPDLGAFAEWLCSFLPSSASASAAGDLAMAAVHHPFYYPLLLGLPLACAYAWLSRRLLRAGVLDSPGGVRAVMFDSSSVFSTPGPGFAISAWPFSESTVPYGCV